eukprot:SAG11_NODE_2341_length_3491_cov_2.180425_2_plen_133_part_00
MIPNVLIPAKIADLDVLHSLLLKITEQRQTKPMNEMGPKLYSTLTAIQTKNNRAKTTKYQRESSHGRPEGHRTPASRVPLRRAVSYSRADQTFELPQHRAPTAQAALDAPFSFFSVFFWRVLVIKLMSFPGT